MKKTISFLFGVAITSVISAQELRVDSGGSLSVYNNASLRVGGNMTVHASGTLTVNSTATDSGTLIVAGTKTGNVTYNRYINDNNWHLVAAPVTTQDINAFAVTDVATNAIETSANVAGNYAVAVYYNGNSATNRWEYYNTNAGGNLPEIASAGNFVSAKGYSTKRTIAGTYTFKGNLAQAITGNVSITVPVDAPSGSVTHLWSAIGNPYTAFLPVNSNADATNLISENTAIFKAANHGIYVWDNTANGGSGDYVLINNSSAAYYLAPGQAFFVNPSATATFNFSEAIQTAQTTATATFYRTSPTPEVVVNLSNNNHIKSTTLRFFNNATNGLDLGYDGGAFKATTSNLSINTHLIENSEGVDMAIQCLPNTNYEALLIPLAVKAAANQEIDFSAVVSNLPEDIKIYLEDKLTNTLTDISTNTHTVEITEAIDGIGRFYIRTSANVLSTSDETLITNKLNIYKTSNNSIRISSLQNNENASLKIFSITGKQLLAHSFKMKTVNDIDLPSNLAKGVYLINVVTNGTKQTKKIIID